MKITEIATILDVPPEDLREDIATRGTGPHKAYNRGKTLSKLQLRKSEMSLAAVGSPIAVENTLQALSEMLDDEL